MPSHAPTAGQDPNKAGHLGAVPYDKEPLGVHHNEEDVTVDTGQIQQVIENPTKLPDGRMPAQELPVTKNNKLRLIWAGIGVAATSALVTAGLVLGNNVAANDKDDTTPKSEPTATGPAVAGQPSPTTETKPVQTTPGEAQPKPVDEWRFYNEDGTFQTAEQVKKTAAASPELRSNVAALDVIFEHAESAINYVADQKTVMDATGKTADQLTLEDYRMVTKQYQELNLDTIVRGNGQLRQLLDTAAGDTTNARFANDDYRMTISQDFIKTQTITISDNADQIGATGDPARTLGTYRVISKGGNDVTVLPRPAEADPDTYIASYTVDGSIGVVKKGQ
jgi:hypothetical protein